MPTQEIQDLIEITREAARLEEKRIAEAKALREEMAGWRQVAQRIEWLMFEVSAIKSAFASLVELLGMTLGQDKATKERVQAILEEQAGKARDGLVIKAGRDVDVAGDIKEE